MNAATISFRGMRRVTVRYRRQTGSVACLRGYRVCLGSGESRIITDRGCPVTACRLALQLRAQVERARSRKLARREAAHRAQMLPADPRPAAGVRLYVQRLRRKDGSEHLMRHYRVTVGAGRSESILIRPGGEAAAADQARQRRAQILAARQANAGGAR